MRVRAFVGLFSCAVLLLTLVGLQPAAAETSSTGAASGVGSDSFNVTYQTPWDGRTRAYRVHLPRGFTKNDGVSRTLVMVLHGGTGTAPSIEASTGWSEKADQVNAIAVYPQGIFAAGHKGGTWNASKACCGWANEEGVDDVRFLTDVVTRMQADYKIAPGRVFVTGMSNGAVMTWRLGCDRPKVFRAIAPNAGDSTNLHPDGSACNLGGIRVPVINFHGDSDDNMPYHGGTGDGPEDYVREPVEDPSRRIHWSDLGQWNELDGCSYNPLSIVRVSSPVTRELWYEKKTFCALSGPRIVNYRVHNGEHEWFHQAENHVSTTDLSWDFFNSFAPTRRPG